MAEPHLGGVRAPRGRCCPWLFSGQFQRHPKLEDRPAPRARSAWILYFLERAEQVLDKQRYWISRGQEFTSFGNAGANQLDLDTLDIPVSRSATTSTAASSRTRHGVNSLDDIGEDNVMCETDYPHSDSTWPDYIDVARDVIRTLTPEVQGTKALRGNAERLYRFTPAEASGAGVTRAPGLVTIDREAGIGSGSCVMYARCVRPGRRGQGVRRGPADRRPRRAVRIAVEAPVPPTPSS